MGLVLACLLAVILAKPLLQAFANSPGLNSAIVVAFLIGVIYIFWQVLRLNPDIQWIAAFRAGGNVTSYARPRLMAPMAAMLRDNSRFSLSASAMRSLLDGIQSQLDESREIARYFTSLLIFLGLLGTFWGLLGTITSVAEAIRNLQVSGVDPATMFGGLKESLEAPLSGMGTAFSASLLGLSGSLVLGYLDLQAGQAQNRFYTELEDWLSSQTKLSSSGTGLSDGEQPIPAYIQALLEQTAESLDQLQRVMAQGVANRQESDTALQHLNHQMAALIDQLQSENIVLTRLTDSQNEMRLVMAKVGELATSGNFGLDQASRTHLRNVDAQMAKLADELRNGRSQTVQEMRGEIKLLARTIAAAAGMERQ